MPIRQIKVKDWLSGKCQYQGCKHNDGKGICSLDDEGLIEELLDLNNEDLSDNEYFNCTYIEVEEKHCEYCNAKLIQSSIKVPYGDTNYNISQLVCPKCG